MMNREQIADLKKKVIDLLRAAETDPAMKPKAEEELAHFILDVAGMEVAGRVFERLKTYILAREKTDPEYVANLMKSIIEGGYPPGWTHRIPSIFEIMNREQEGFWSRTSSLSDLIACGEDSVREPTTLEEIIANPTAILPPAVTDVRREISRWVEELAREAEANKDQVKRETLDALILHIKHLIALCNGGSSFSLYKLTTVPVEALLENAHLSGFNAGLFDKTKSQWTIKRDTWQFLGTIMELFIKTRVEGDPNSYRCQIQNRVRQRVNRVLPALCAVRIRCQSDVLGVEGICCDRNLHPGNENINEGGVQ